MDWLNRLESTAYLILPMLSKRRLASAIAARSRSIQSTSALFVPPCSCGSGIGCVSSFGTGTMTVWTGRSGLLAQAVSNVSRQRLVSPVAVFRFRVIDALPLFLFGREPQSGVVFGFRLVGYGLLSCLLGIGQVAG